MNSETENPQLAESTAQPEQSPAPAAQPVPAVQPAAQAQQSTPNFDPRRRLRELLSVPERDRTDPQWDEINELEIQLAPGNRINPGQMSHSEKPLGGGGGRPFPQKKHPPKGGGGGNPGGNSGGKRRPPRPNNPNNPNNTNNK